MLESAGVSPAVPLMATTLVDRRRRGNWRYRQLLARAQGQRLGGAHGVAASDAVLRRRRGRPGRDRQARAAHARLAGPHPLDGRRLHRRRVVPARDRPDEPARLARHRVGDRVRGAGDQRPDRAVPRARPRRCGQGHLDHGGVPRGDAGARSGVPVGGAHGRARRRHGPDHRRRRDRHAGEVAPPAYRSACCARSLYLRTLPPTVTGRSSTTRTALGVSNPASLVRQNAISSSASGAWPGAAMTNAVTASPQCSWGSPTTAAFITAGCWTSTDSTRRLETFSPPDFTMSLDRSTMIRRPSSSYVQTSPEWNQPPRKASRVAASSL